ncbi:MAG: shikimate kinase [Bacteroidales bacterium]|nr:shikimate kinase [Bacteroidales bacterium]
MKIVLIGYMFSGKTTVGKRIAKMLDFPFIDTDFEIEKRCRLSVEDIFKLKGEEFFRQEEHSLFSELMQRDNIVISAGGGLPVCKDNMQLIKQNCKSIYLNLTPSQILSRAKNSKKIRPLIHSLPEEERLKFITKSLQEREKFYRQADITIGGLNVSDFILEMTLKELNKDLW